MIERKVNNNSKTDNFIRKIRDWLGLDERIAYFNGFDVKTAPKDDRVMTTAELVLPKKDRENAR